MDKSPVGAGGYTALASLSLCMLLSALGTSIANVALPSLVVAFDAPFREVQWVVIAYILAVTTLVVVAGRLGDATGRRRLLLVGIALFTLASIACAVMPSLRLLIAARAAQGIGAAIMMALTTAFVADAVPRAKSGSAMGLLGTVSAIGTALGPSVGGMVIAYFGWRWVFALNVPLGILALGLAYRYLPVDRARVVASAHPLLPWGMLRSRPLGRALAANTLVSTVMMATLIVGPFYLSVGLGLDAAMVGLSMSVGPAVVALAGVPAGLAVDRIGTPRVVIGGLIAMALGSLALFMTSTALGVAGYIAPIVVITLGYALFQTANNTAVMAPVGPRDRGAVSGLLNLSRNLGLVGGAYVMGAIFAALSGFEEPASALPEAVAHGMHGTFGVAALVLVLAAAIEAPRAKRRTVASAATVAMEQQT